MRTLNIDAFYDACLLAFQGVRYDKIGERLGFTRTTISNWAQRSEWKELHKELREKNASRCWMPSSVKKHHRKKRGRNPPWMFPMCDDDIFFC